ncbi:hypothetical protein C7H19_15595 [Aphanothece hegewaldii CCALA 016]|uniref:Uncharacterized protein n=1 Tax=Aphanothece hegewaldii CCALA 016 TaxID=2107694 RepID=A0A2T1LVJ6_9CHRO|nr:hypothetical protein [Aphanothece hegewaldii]PSF35664.1 hypothetical protein C7H19_15595 [Aphanothece hegewaldii CCALA 016]
MSNSKINLFSSSFNEPLSEEQESLTASRLKSKGSETLENKPEKETISVFQISQEKSINQEKIEIEITQFSSDNDVSLSNQTNLDQNSETIQVNQALKVRNYQQAFLIADPRPNPFRITAPQNLHNLAVGIPNPQTSNTVINVNYNGFTPAAQAAFQYAVDIWESLIDSPVQINLTANFTPLGAGILGSAGPTDFWRNFTNAPQTKTWYSSALANSLAGTDLDPSTPEIEANFSSSFNNWYFGTDANTPGNKYDFVSVVLHEIGHGLGFFSFFNYNNGSGNWGLNTGFPSTFDRFVKNGAGKSLINTNLFPNPSTALGNQLTDTWLR